MLRSRTLRRWSALAVAVLLASAIVPSTGTTPASAQLLPTLPGLLTPGTYPISVFQSGNADTIYRKGTDPEATLRVINLADGNSQRHVYDLAPGVIEWTLLAQQGLLDRLVKPTGTYLREFVMMGIYFTPSAPVRWREVNAAGIVVPLVPWSWTVNSGNGNVRLSQESVAQLPTVEIHNLLPVVVQRIDTTMTFSGNITGTLYMTAWEAVGDTSKSRIRFNGTLTIFGSRSVIDTTVGVGGIGQIPV